MIRYAESPPLSNEILNALFVTAWPEFADTDLQSVLAKSLGYIAAFDDDRLIGFVNVATDGGSHAFLLDTCVHPDFQRRGIGSELVRRAIKITKSKGAVWLHVDFEPHLEKFYRACGFGHTAAGLIDLTTSSTRNPS